MNEDVDMGDVEELTHSVSKISFEGLRSGSAGVRLTDEVPQLLWAVDLVMVVTGKSRKGANESLVDIPTSLFDTGRIRFESISGNGKWPVKLISFEHALELIMVLPGTAAKAFRLQACDILRRFFAGDPTLHSEIDRNGKSSGAIQQLSRASLTNVKKIRFDPFLPVSVDDIISRTNAVCDLYNRYAEIQGREKDSRVSKQVGDVILGHIQLLAPQGSLVPPSSRGADALDGLSYIYCLGSVKEPVSHFLWLSVVVSWACFCGCLWLSVVVCGLSIEYLWGIYRVSVGYL